MHFVPRTFVNFTPVDFVNCPFLSGAETPVLLLHAKRVLLVVIVLSPTLPVKFSGLQMLQVKNTCETGETDDKAGLPKKCWWQKVNWQMDRTSD